MTDTNPSGAPVAPAADPSAPAARAETPAGNFGSTRGSGLARGKRQSSASAPAASPVKTDYKPTAVEIITPQREYKNPFASQEPASEPAEAPVIEQEAPVAPAAIAEPEPAPAPAPEAPAAQEQVEEKSEIQILPPAEPHRPATSWESPSISEGRRDSQSGDRPQRDDRPTFRPDRREDQNGASPEGQRPRFEGRDPRRDFQRQPRDPRDARQPRDPREARQPRDPREARQPRDPRDERDERDERPSQSQPAPEPATPASGGFFGWLKGLFVFGSPKPAETPAPREGGGEPFGDGHRHRRRHRGGRGHGGQHQGFRPDRPEFGGDRPQGERGEHGGERHGGHRRRRHRGGQGRGRGGEPRSEGHQGGGAI